MISLSGKVALVTGGAVGKELAGGFLKAGASVAFVYRNPERRGEIEKSFGSFEKAFFGVPADLSDLTQAKEAAASVKERFGRIDFLANSLGGWLGGKKLHEHSAADFQKMLSIDLIPTFGVMAAVLPIMSDQKFGRVVNFISLSALSSGVNSSVYAASKSAILSLTGSAAEEYKNYGVKVCAIAPSIIDTPANRRSMPNADFTKWVRVEEIVEAVLFLCGTDTSINNTILKLPGRL